MSDAAAPDEPPGDGPVPEEATAGMRQAARWCRDMYVALLAENFTEAQALTMIGSVLSGSAKSGDG